MRGAHRSWPRRPDGINRGQRAFFLALGYLGWFISGWVLNDHRGAARHWQHQFISPAPRALDN
jgi:uncharacterized membrane protein